MRSMVEGADRQRRLALSTGLRPVPLPRKAGKEIPPPPGEVREGAAPMSYRPPRKAADDLGDDKRVALADPFGRARRRWPVLVLAKQREDELRRALVAFRRLVDELLHRGLKLGDAHRLAVFIRLDLFAKLSLHQRADGLPSSAARADCRTGRGGSGWRAAAGGRRFRLSLPGESLSRAERGGSRVREARVREPASQACTRLNVMRVPLSSKDLAYSCILPEAGCVGRGCD